MDGANRLGDWIAMRAVVGVACLLACLLDISRVCTARLVGWLGCENLGYSRHWQ
jgi:hypothetical protein